MKTQHLRQDNTCLNCGHQVPDRFCSHCGQENVDTKESFGHLVSHFFQDITHYDSKLLLSLKYLFFYPGKLTKEYISGKRMTFVNPIRLYVFTSFVFFLLIGVVNHADSPYEVGAKDKSNVKFGKIRKTADRMLDSIRLGKVDPEDTARMRATAENLKLLAMDTIHNAARVYDSIQQSLPPHLRDDWGDRKVTLRTLEMREKYGENMENALEDKIAHHYPKLMFLLLPFFALLLKWFFPRKTWVYGDHAIFSIHIHTLIFMLGIVAMLVNMFLHYDALYAWLLIPIYVYFLFSLRNAYGVTFGKALLKSLGILLGYVLGTAIVGLVFVLIIFAIT
ncbi:DUF3667 domain-containing protein [Chitinophaga deserti]|uniref:DUF3667 domain-containing protein n=1 Tax=Chitinophaga deserti TaxID=2164099 RepID=UPI000D6B3CF0|nr:DUF3667 domain-containing protein [Chitinophaga deserti]